MANNGSADTSIKCAHINNVKNDVTYKQISFLRTDGEM